jgi:uncharacterized protein YjbJ (UPF0337 family)
MIRASEKK